MVSLRLPDILAAGVLRRRAIVIQQKTGRPVQFEITEQARRSLSEWLKLRRGEADGWLFPSRLVPGAHLSTRQYIRLLKGWIALIGLEPAEYGTHSLRRTKVSSSTERPAISERASYCLDIRSLRARCAISEWSWMTLWRCVRR